jgi:hypothetical protein
MKPQRKTAFSATNTENRLDEVLGVSAEFGIGED